MNIYDSVHGFIRCNELEGQLIDSLPFQRLHYIHQLGIAYLVYPGGTHTRFEHSLGVMEIATQIYDRIVTSYQEPVDQAYWRQVLRLAALCHDLGHLPFSHLAEKALLGDGGHEKWTLRMIQSPYLQPILKQLGSQAVDDVIKISIGEKKLRELSFNCSFTPWERVVSEIVTGDFFGADRIDYLLRDAQCTGVAYGLIDYQQLIEMLRVLPFHGRLELGIEENGIQSCEALLLARHFMYRRVYQYATAKAYSFHLLRFMKALYATTNFDDLELYLWTTDNEVLSAVNKAAREGNPDASALVFRHHRFRAIELGEPVQESSLEKFKKSLNISDEKIFWEFSHQKRQKIGLSFPLLKHTGVVCDASQFSEIAIPSGSFSWVYVAPELENAMRQFLEEL